MFMDVAGDLKTAIRSMTRAPGTSALIVLTLGSAIAAATIGFTFADFALLRGLPVDDSSRVVSIFASDTHGSNPRARVSGPDFLDIRGRSTTLEQMAVFRDGDAPLIRNGQSQTLRVSYTTSNLFDVMGQPAIRGRTFAAGDDQPGAVPVALLSHRYWQQSMSGRDDALGQTMQIGREHFAVVGVMTPELEFGNVAEIDVWLPLRIDPDGPRDARNLRFFARLKAPGDFDRAAAEIATIGQTLAKEYPDSNGGWSLRLAPVSELAGGNGFWVVIALFLLSVGLLIAIATANVSNLVLARVQSRIGELAVRTALGARRGRLVRQFVTEGLMLSAAAALLSFPLAFAGLQAIRATSPELVFQQLTIDLHEITFVALVTIVCPLVFSIAPVRLLSRPDMRRVLAGSGTRGATATTRGRGALVVVQVALAVVLLTVSSLSLRSIRQIYTAPIGMQTAGVTLMDLDFNEVLYPNPAQAFAAAMETRDRLAALPRVNTVAMINALPILGDRVERPLVLDVASGEASEVKPVAVVTSTTPEGGSALGLTMLAGSWWAPGASDVAVISRATAERYFGGIEQAIGRRFRVNEADVAVNARIIGISSDVANTDRTSLPPARVWLPLTERSRRLTFMIKSDDQFELASRIRATIAATAAAVPIEYLQTFDEALREAASSDYAVIGSLTGFALLALLLASIGLFGVVSYGVAQRTAEFGTRMALGASASDVVRLVARQSIALLLIGMTIGLAIGVGIGFAMGSVLNELSPLDPVSIGSVLGLLAVVTLAATALPAWRAARIDPVVALRAE